MALPVVELVDAGGGGDASGEPWGRVGLYDMSGRLRRREKAEDLLIIDGYWWGIGQSAEQQFRAKQGAKK